MCNSCGCNVTSGNRHLLEAGGKLEHSQGRRTIQVLEGLLDENDHQAMHNREHLDQHQVVAINLMSSPGSGKTRLLEACLPKLAQRGIRVGVIEGDLETENDAARIRKHGVPVLQITTGMACHLDAHMVHNALHYLPLAELDLVFIENVGNLVCPASFDLGQHQDVVLLSATEGDDKPCKYPVMFRSADRVLITKIDLLAHFDDFDARRAQANLAQLGLAQPAWQVSAKSEQGLDAWLAWLAELVGK